LIRAYRETALLGSHEAGRIEKFALREFVLQGINYNELGLMIQAIESKEGRIANIGYDQKISLVVHLFEFQKAWLNNMVKNVSHGRATIQIGQLKWYKKA